MFQLRFRAGELLDVREGRQALVDIKPFSQSDLEKTNHFFLVFVLKSAAYSSGGCRTTTCSPFFFR